MTVLIRRKRARRDVLRGMLAGSAVTVALPFLDCDLTDSGTALAATGAPLPVRFGTWNWGMGRSPGSVESPTRTAQGIKFGEETAALKPYEKNLLYFDGYNLPLDGHSNFTHYVGWVANRTGSTPASTSDIPGPTLDLLIADQIGSGTRFKTLDVSSVGLPENYSARGSDSRAAAETSPISLYTRIFGPDFIDPNKADFKPNPMVMAKKSVLSAVYDDNRSYFKNIGAADQARLDEYFTAVRQLEGQLAIQLEKPPHNDACLVPKQPGGDVAAGGTSVREMPQVMETHKIMASLLAMAVACNQTNVFNMIFTDVTGTVRRPGEAYTHHLLTHNETVDAARGYQPSVHALLTQCMEGLADYLKIFSSIREGSGTLLDNCLIFATSESNWARVHSIDSIPIMFAGNAGGRIKQGMHVVGGGDPVTRVGFTAMSVMGVKLDKWGTRSLETSKAISEIIV